MKFFSLVNVLFLHFTPNWQNMHVTDKLTSAFFINDALICSTFPFSILNFAADPFLVLNIKKIKICPRQELGQTPAESAVVFLW